MSAYGALLAAQAESDPIAEARAIRAPGSRP